jgi:hypothetical protein
VDVELQTHEPTDIISLKPIGRSPGTFSAFLSILGRESQVISNIILLSPEIIKVHTDNAETFEQGCVGNE